MTDETQKPEPSSTEELSEVERYKPTENEIAAIQRWSAKKARTKTPRLSVEHLSGSTWKTEYDHVAQALAKIQLSDAIGCPDPDFRDGLICDLLSASHVNGKVDEMRLNMGLAVVKDIQPTDAVEAMLATQMFAVHMATITYAERTLDNRLVEDRAEPCFNRLARTFTTQVEALKRYRSKGEQVVRVERVYVGEGGQAVVGNVTHEGGAKREIGGQPNASNGLAAPSGAPLSGALQTDQSAVPEPCSARASGVPRARRVRRRAEGQHEQPKARTQ